MSTESSIDSRPTAPSAPPLSAPNLHMTVMKAENLYKKSFFSMHQYFWSILHFSIEQPDPFVVVTVDGEQTHTSVTDKQTLNPFWNAECDLIVTNASVITVQVFDQKRFKKEHQGFLGVLSFIVGNIIDIDASAPASSSQKGKLFFLESIIMELKAVSPMDPVRGTVTMVLATIPTHSSLQLPQAVTSDTALVNPELNLAAQHTLQQDEHGYLPPGWEEEWTSTGMPSTSITTPRQPLGSDHQQMFLLMSSNNVKWIWWNNKEDCINNVHCLSLKHNQQSEIIHQC